MPTPKRARAAGSLACAGSPSEREPLCIAGRPNDATPPEFPLAPVYEIPASGEPEPPLSVKTLAASAVKLARGQFPDGKRKGQTMHIEKATIIRHLRARGHHRDAIRADRALPDRIHTAQDVEFFERWGLDPSEIEKETFRDRPPRDY